MKTTDNDNAKTEPKKPSECLPQHPHYEGDDRNFANALEYEFAYGFLSLGVDNALSGLIRTRADLQIVLNIAFGLMCGWSGDDDDVYRDAYDAALAEPIEPGTWRKLKLAEETADATMANAHGVKDDFHPRTLVGTLIGAARLYVRQHGPEADAEEEDREKERAETLRDIARACHVAAEEIRSAQKRAERTPEAIAVTRSLLRDRAHDLLRPSVEYPDAALTEAAAAVAKVIEALAGEPAEEAAQ